MISCPCRYTTPCHLRCTCVLPISSWGCLRCCSHGSHEQRVAKAERLAAAIDATPRIGDGSVSLSDAEWKTVLDAVRVSPDPEGYDFGPAYEFAKRDREAVYHKVHAAVTEPRRTSER